MRWFKRKHAFWYEDNKETYGKTGFVALPRMILSAFLLVMLWLVDRESGDSLFLFCRLYKMSQASCQLILIAC